MFAKFGLPKTFHLQSTAPAPAPPASRRSATTAAAAAAAATVPSRPNTPPPATSAAGQQKLGASRKPEDEQWHDDSRPRPEGGNNGGDIDGPPDAKRPKQHHHDDQQQPPPQQQQQQQRGDPWVNRPFHRRWTPPKNTHFDPPPEADGREGGGGGGGPPYPPYPTEDKGGDGPAITAKSSSDDDEHGIGSSSSLLPSCSCPRPEDFGLDPRLLQRYQEEDDAAEQPEEPIAGDSEGRNGSRGQSSSSRDDIKTKAEDEDVNGIDPADQPLSSPHSRKKKFEGSTSSSSSGWELQQAEQANKTATTASSSAAVAAAKNNAAAANNNIEQSKSTSNKKSEQPVPTNTHNGDGKSKTDEEDEASTHMTIPPSQAAKVTSFPPPCPVLVYDPTSMPPVYTGQVSSVYIDFAPGSDRAFLYRVKPDLPLPGGATRITVVESKLRYGPECPVLITVDDDNDGKVTTEGIVASSYETAGEGGAQTTKYSVRIINPSAIGSPSSVSVRHGVGAENVRYRPKDQDGVVAAAPAVEVKNHAEEKALVAEESGQEEGDAVEDKAAGKNSNKSDIDKENTSPPGTYTSTTKPSTAEENGGAGIADPSPVPSTVVLPSAHTKKNGKKRISDVTMKTTLEEDSTIETGTRSGSVASSAVNKARTAGGNECDAVDVAVAVGIVRGLDLEKIRDSLYGPDKSTKKKMEKSLGVAVTIVGIEFDRPDPCVRVGGSSSSSGHYVLIRGPSKKVQKAEKVVVHMLVEKCSSGLEDKDRLRRELSNATAECIVATRGGEETSASSAGAGPNSGLQFEEPTTGENSFYSSMQQSGASSRSNKQDDWSQRSLSTKQRHLSDLSGPPIGSGAVVKHLSGPPLGPVKHLSGPPIGEMMIRTPRANVAPAFIEHKIDFPVWVDADRIGEWIIGTGGEVINRMKDASGCEISIYGRGTPRLGCIIRGPNQESVDYARVWAENVAVKATDEPERARLLYDLAVSNQHGGKEYDWESDPRDGLIVSQRWGTSYGMSPSCKAQDMAIVDLSLGVVERPSILLHHIGDLQRRTHCTITLYGAGNAAKIAEPYAHVVGHSYESVDECVRHIHWRLSSA